jgi:hypothetical protein
VGLPVQWLCHLPQGKERQELEQHIRNSTLVLGRLREIILKEIEGIDHWENNSNYYDNPSWSHKQAHMNGQRSSYQDLLRLLSFMDK